MCIPNRFKKCYVNIFIVYFLTQSYSLPAAENAGNVAENAAADTGSVSTHPNGTSLSHFLTLNPSLQGPVWRWMWCPWTHCSILFIVLKHPSGMNSSLGWLPSFLRTSQQKSQALPKNNPVYSPGVPTMQQEDPEILQYILTWWKMAWQPIVGKHPLGHTGGYNVYDRFYLLHGFRP